MRRRTVLLEELKQLADIRPAEPLLVFERELEKASLEVTGKQEEVVGVDQAFVRVGAQEVLGMADDELVERRAGRHEDADRTRPPSRPTELLPGRRDGARVADEDRRLEAADVDAELKGVGAHHACDLSTAQAGLDLSTMQGQVPGSIAAHALVGIKS